MAEAINYDVPPKRDEQTPEELDQLLGRLGELNRLLGVLQKSGALRLMRSSLLASPAISRILLGGLNTPSGRNGLRNAAIILEQLGRMDPDHLERVFNAVRTGVERVGEPVSPDRPYPPGVTGLYRLLRDEELWRSLGPVIEGIRAFSQTLREGDGGENAKR